MDQPPNRGIKRRLDDNEDSEEEAAEMKSMVRSLNRKKKKSGGFQSMGLSWPVYKGIMHKGYKIPTPIQRKTVPIIMDGKDVVAMARTGSGKTAAFLVPMFERLKDHCPTGIRALILAPTRELAVQTLKFTKELGKYTTLKFVAIVGGDKIEDQFGALHENPDVLIATPGRLMHILIEMELKLSQVQYVVFDEADRLFEMGFQDQLQEILSRLPESRQTLLFSATLPKMLVEFASAGLTSPELIRLDVDKRLSDQLRMAFLQCRADDKTALLLHLLKCVVKPSEQTVIFVATKHDVEYINLILRQAGFRCSIAYSALDQLARKISIEKFQTKQTMIMIVTDLAARGIDIPLLDNVINYNFPAKPKLFQHRVGRVARAGRAGVAYSLVSLEEKAYVLDLHMSLSRPFKLAKETFAENKDEDGLYGLVPQCVIDDEEEQLREWNKLTDIQNMSKVVKNAFKRYIKTRPPASTESIKRVKRGMSDLKVGYHPIFGPKACNMGSEREKLLEALKTYKPHSDRLSIGLPTELPVNRVEEKTKPVTKKPKTTAKDEENYLNYVPADFQSENALSLGTAFEREASGAVLDLVGDDEDAMKRQKSRMVWDRKKKKFVRNDQNSTKTIRTESGAKISASYKKDLYKTWLEKGKISHQEEGDSDSEQPESKRRSFGGGKKFGGNRKFGGGQQFGEDQKFGGDRKFGEGSRQFGGDRKFGVGDSKFGGGDRKFGGGDRKFGGGDRKFGGEGRQFGGDRKSGGRNFGGSQEKSYIQGPSWKNNSVGGRDENQGWKNGQRNGGKGFGKGQGKGQAWASKGGKFQDQDSSFSSKKKGPRGGLKQKDQILKDRRKKSKVKSFQQKQAAKKQNRKGGNAKGGNSHRKFAGKSGSGKSKRR